MADYLELIAAIIVALLGLLGGYITRQQGIRSKDVESRAERRLRAEDEAYGRARKLDTDTITRQNAEIEDMHSENQDLRERIDRLEVQMDAMRSENHALQLRVTELEQELVIYRNNN